MIAVLVLSGAVGCGAVLVPGSWPVASATRREGSITPSVPSAAGTAAATASASFAFPSALLARGATR